MIKKVETNLIQTIGLVLTEAQIKRGQTLKSVSILANCNLAAKLIHGDAEDEKLIKTIMEDASECGIITTKCSTGILTLLKAYKSSNRFSKDLKEEEINEMVYGNYGEKYLDTPNGKHTLDRLKNNGNTTMRVSDYYIYQLDHGTLEKNFLEHGVDVNIRRCWDSFTPTEIRDWYIMPNSTKKFTLYYPVFPTVLIELTSGK